MAAAPIPNSTQKEEVVEHAKPDVTLTLQHHGQLEIAQPNSSETYHLHTSRPHQSFIDHGLFSGETFKIRPVTFCSLIGCHELTEKKSVKLRIRQMTFEH